MNINNCIDEFKKYIANYDLNIEQIDYKYNHTLRVVDYAKIICDSEKITEEEKELALISALLHDIGRFEEWMQTKSFFKIDHGEKGYEILKDKNYILNYVSKEYSDLVLDVVRYHNKKDIPDNLDKQTLKILKIVRDADKIDVLNTQVNENDKKITKEYIISDDIIETFLNEEMLDQKNINNTALRLMYHLAFLYDINYRSSFKLIYSLNILEKKLNFLYDILKKKEQYKIIEIKIKDYLESNIKL